MKEYSIVVNGKTYDVQVLEKEGAATASPLQAQPKAPAVVAAPPAPPIQAEMPKSVAPATPAPAGVVAGRINAPMPGVVLQLLVKEGDPVKASQVLLTLEAMKMENEIIAPCDGVVTHIAVAKGATVEMGDPLITLG